MHLIRLDNVSKFYKSEETVSVGMKKVSLDFNLGEFVAITGESGSGKSTLLNVLSGLDGYEDGELYLFGEETSHYTIADWEKYRGTYIGFVFQNYNIIDSYTVLQNVLLALEVQGYPKDKRKSRALELIDQVGLTSHKNHKASKLSGGQKQRAVIARALAKDCPIIVADEPTGNLDSQSAEQVMKLLYEISKDKLIIVVTHDYEQVKPFATRRVKMHDGEPVEDKKIKPYTHKDIEAFEKPKKFSFPLLMRFAIRNLLSMPKKLIFMLILQILVITVFTLVYTNQISGIREAGLGQSDIFPSVPETRLIIERRDGLPFTSGDYQHLEDIRFVKGVYKNGANFFNEMSVHFRNMYDQSFRVSGTDASEFLSSRNVRGRLPQSKYEIVISDQWDEIKIGDELKLYPGMYWNYNTTIDPLGTFTVVGIDRLNREIVYFHDDYLLDIAEQQTYIDQSKYNQVKDYLTWNMRISFATYNELEAYNGGMLTYDIELEGRGNTEVLTHSVTFKTYSKMGRPLETTRSLEILIPSEMGWYALISDKVFTSVIDEFMPLFASEYTIEPRNYVSVSVEGFYAGNQVVRNIDSSIYKAYYPSNISEPMREFMVFFLGLIALVFLTLFGMFLYSIVHAVSRNIMNARKKDFAIFRSIGTNQKTLARLVVLEQVILAAVGFLITMGILEIIGEYVPLIRGTLQYMQPQDFAILMTAFILFGAWLGLRFNKKVFNQSVIETLTMSKGE